MTKDNSTADDKIVYFGVININEKGRTIGAIDVWRSSITKELFCEEKRLGVLEIVDEIGMPKIESDRKWAVAINNIREGRDRWKLVKLTKEGEFKFIDTDDETSLVVNVKDYSIIDSRWWSFLIEKNINHTVELTEHSTK